MDSDKTMLRVNERIAVPLAEFDFTFSRSSLRFFSRRGARRSFATEVQ